MTLPPHFAVPVFALKEWTHSTVGITINLLARLLFTLEEPVLHRWRKFPCWAAVAVGFTDFVLVFSTPAQLAACLAERIAEQASFTRPAMGVSTPYRMFIKRAILPAGTFFAHSLT